MKTWIPYCFFLFPCILNLVVWALGVSYNNFFPEAFLTVFSLNQCHTVPY